MYTSSQSLTKDDMQDPSTLIYLILGNSKTKITWQIKHDMPTTFHGKKYSCIIKILV